MEQQDTCIDQLVNDNDLDRTTLIPIVETSKEPSSDDETTSSGVYSDYTTFSTTCGHQYSVMNCDPSAQLFENTMLSLENNPLMKVYKSSQFIKEAINLYKKSEVIQNKWASMIDYYKNGLKCDDHNRIQFEFGKCIGAILNDERKIMIALDSTEVVEDVLITCMRICSKPNFKLEIRVGLGGTTDSLTARTSAYAIAPVALLYRLLELSKSSSEVVPTQMLRNRPLLIFYSAYTAAVEANNIDESIAKKTACDILSYIQAYINKYHPDLTEYVRYGIDHTNSYQSNLLQHITGLFNSNCDDKTLLEALATQAKTHGSTMENSIRYASTHSIGFRDVIDKRNSHALFYPLNQNDANAQSDQQIDLPDCIISIGGSVERRFGQGRHIVRRAFRESLQNDNEDQYHLPLSIRMLSKAGETPVYYHYPKHEITFNDVLNSNTIDLYQNKEIPRAIKEDLLIITDDICVRILKPMLESITTNKSSEIFSWEKPITTLTQLCCESLEEHAKYENQTCECSEKTDEPVAQFFEHYSISNYLNNDIYCSVISCIINCLENQKRKQKQKQEQRQAKKQNLIQSATNYSRPRSDTLPSAKSATNKLRPRSETVSSTKSATSDSRSRSNTVSSTECATNDPRPRSNTASSTGSATSDSRPRSDSQGAAVETINNIKQQCDSIFCKIFVAFIKEFGKNNHQ